MPSASFVFVLSDFIEPTPLETWEWALDRGWDIVPVVIQDPVWEQSRRWRERHEERLAGLIGGLRSLGIEPVLVSEAEREHVFEAFLTWSGERQAAWGHAA